MLGQHPQDRHDLISRVFHLKLRKLIDSIIRYSLFGSCQAYTYTVEWQKRGLPHAHILIWLHGRIRPESSDSIISAELPGPEVDPDLSSTEARSGCDGLYLAR